MKKHTIDELNKLANQIKEREVASGLYDRVEIVSIPIVLCKKNNRIEKIARADVDRIFKLENE